MNISVHPDPKYSGGGTPQASYTKWNNNQTVEINVDTKN